ncbi:MAG: hypothetical protein J7M06_03435 [Proteobacteria bacterium]|nr:hypothetical protein [Pseudomonadota bacterium]
MTNIMPEGESLRKAVKWISENRKVDSDKPVIELVNEATMRFDLSPNDGEFLIKFYRDRGKEE